MTFSPTMQVFEVQTHSEDAENLERWRNSKRSKVRRKNIMKDSALVPLKSFRISTFGLNNSDSINYQIWKKKLRKFRATSWVVKICTDFVFCQNTFVSSFWINNLLHFCRLYWGRNGLFFVNFDWFWSCFGPFQCLRDSIWRCLYERKKI